MIGRRSRYATGILYTDHGEEFFEHGVFGHHQNMFDTTLQIPLVIWGPSLIPAGKSVSSQVRIIDIMPTIIIMSRDLLQ